MDGLPLALWEFYLHENGEKESDQTHRSHPDH